MQMLPLGPCVLGAGQAPPVREPRSWKLRGRRALSSVFIGESNLEQELGAESPELTWNRCPAATGQGAQRSPV